MKPQFQQRTIAPGVLPGISMDQLKQSICKCGWKEFTPVFQVHFASQFQTVTGNIMAVQVPCGFICSACGTPLGVKEEDEKKDEEKYKCSVCKSSGFKPSITGEGCTFCDGTEGGNPPEKTGNLFKQ